MNISDIKNTVEGRHDIIKYIEYLQTGNELLTADFCEHVVSNVFTKASMIAMKDVISRIMDKLNEDVGLEHKTVMEADSEFNKARDMTIKHCLILELKHNHIKKDDRKSSLKNSN